MRPRYLPVILCVLAVTQVPTTPVLAHDQARHAAHASADPDTGTGPQILAAESLQIPNAPVVDSEYHREGFVSRYQGKGQLLISFTYTGCETLCPISNAVLQQVDRRMSDMAEPPLHIVTLSIDPASDTPAALQASREVTTQPA